MLVIALANNKYYVWHSIRATVYLYFVLVRYQFIQLFRCQFVGVDAEYKAVDGQIEFCFGFQGKLMFYFAKCLFRHQLTNGILIIFAVLPRTI